MHGIPGVVMHGWRRRQRILVAVGVGTVAAIAASAVIWLLQPPTDADPVRERRYRDATACLLTDDKGLTGEPTAATWAGMQDASTATLVKIQYLSVSGPQTPANALTYFNSLASQSCTVLIAVGEIPVAGMTAGRSRFPATRYAAVGHDPADPTVTLIDAAPEEATRTAIRELVTRTP